MVKQYQLNDMPAKDELYLLCEEYIELKKTIEETKDVMEQMKPQLLEAFKKDGREYVVVNGCTVSYREMAKITVKGGK